MRAVIQRVTEASVTVDHEVIGQITHGLLVLLGVGVDDDIFHAARIAEKIASLRIFNDPDGKMNLSVEDVKGAILLVSQFTVYGDVHKGNRPSFFEAADPKKASYLYESVLGLLRARKSIPVQTGRFGAHMEVRLLNDGPVTILLDTKAVD